MSDKYLPIGTVCTIEGRTEKLMIVGFKEIEYNGKFISHDYQGCIYPQGLSSKRKINFNHEDIKEVVFLGYKDKEFSDFQDKLSNDLNLNDVLKKEPLEDEQNTSPFKFDEFGMIILDDSDDQIEEVQENKSENPFILKYMPESKPEYKKEQIISKFQFDENGVIIADNTATPDNQTSEFQFDENGMIIADNTATPSNEESKEETKFKFDENGVIIAES